MSNLCVLSLIFELTLKQTQSEKGSVARTMAQEIAVRIQPQRPMPSSVSSAETKIKGFLGLVEYVLRGF